MANKRIEFTDLERASQTSVFWQMGEKAVRISQRINQLKKEIKQFDELKKEVNDLKELCEMLVEEDINFSQDIEEKIDDVKTKIQKKEIEVSFSGKYDKGDAILSIHAGTGGQDAEDWVAMLLRMYEKYSQRKGFQTKILHQSFGEPGGPEGRIGLKEVSLEIKGEYAYGFLKKEMGVHRLVRISPFSSKQLRHTSFALVEVLPVITGKETEIKIDPKDLRIDFFRSSGPGGQNVNKRETAVRITHLPTGIQVSCQSERTQGLNRELAMKILISKLFQLKETKQKRELEKIKGEKISASWGNQTRNYILHPYKMIKDLQTQKQILDVEKILVDGNLDILW